MTTDSLPQPYRDLARFTTVELHYPGDPLAGEIIHQAMTEMLESGRDPLHSPLDQAAKELAIWLDVHLRMTSWPVKFAYADPREFPADVEHALAKARRKVLRQGEFAL